MADWLRYAEYSPGDPGQSRRSHRTYPRYRYLLGGELRDPNATALLRPRIPGTLLWIGLNPSTATHLWDDPTVRRIQRFTLDAGYGRYEIVNLFGFRSRHPEELSADPDPVGLRNREQITGAIRTAERVVCAWGAVPTAAIRKERAEEIRHIYGILTVPGATASVCLGFTASGAPRHPLFLSRRAPMLAMSWDWVPDSWRRSA